MKSGTTLFPSSVSNIKDGIRAHSTTIIYEITSLEEAKLIMFPAFPPQVLISSAIIWFASTGSFCPYLNTNLLPPLPSHQNTVTGHGEAALRSYKNVKQQHILH